MGVNVTGGALEFDAIINDSQFGATIRRIESQLQGLSKTAEHEAAQVEKLIGRTTQAIAGYLSFTTGTDFVGDIVRVRGEFQQLEIAFTTMLGSKEKADKLLAEVTEFAATTPFELSEVAGATKQLLAFGISADKIKGTLRALGDVSAGIGAPLGEIAYLFGTIKTQGVALTQDVRQFAQRGIPIYQELAKVLGVNTEQVGEFITAGKVGFPEIEKVFKSLTAEGSQFGGLMEAQSKSLTGQLSNLRDAWDQMLNTIGKGQEGLFSDIISGATFVVKHFEDIIDILKVLVLTYGSYRAAVIATNVVNSIATSLTKGYTVAELLRYQAMLLTERANKLLNATMLKNPAAFVVAGIVGIITALAVFGKSSTEARSKAELLEEATKKVGDAFAEKEAKIRPYVEELKAGNVAEDRRLEIYNKLVQIDPTIVAGLNAKTLSYQNLADNVNKYLDALRSQLGLEANKEAVTASIKTEQELIGLIKKKQQEQKRFNEEAEKLKKRGDTEGAGLAQFSAQASATDEKVLLDRLENQKKVTQELGETQVKSEKETQVVKKRTVEIIEDEIKALKKQREQQSETNAQYVAFTKQITVLEEEKKRIIGETKAELKAAETLENKALALLEKRKDLLEKIAEQQRNADVSGMTKQQSELDKINERYDDVIKNISEYNEKVDQFNKKNPKNQVQKVGQQDILALNSARTQELSNQRLKDDAENFKKSLDTQRGVFEKYEEAKKQIGITKSKELFGEQLKGFESYQALLNSELKSLTPKVLFGIANVGEVEKFKALLKELNEFQKKQAADDIEEQKKKFIELLAATGTFNQRKALINKKYDDLEATLNKNKGVSDFEERMKLLKQGREEELTQLGNDLARSSDLYKKLNQDILLYSRERIKQEIKDLKEKLKVDTKLTPQQKADIQGVISQYEGLLDETNKVATDFAKLSGDLGQTSQIFGAMAGALEGVNDEVSEFLQGLSDIQSIASDVASAIASFASGDVLGGIGSSVSAITKIFSLGKKAREQRRREEQERKDFLNAQFIGEQEINLLYQQRARDQVKLNKLRLQGLEDERKLLQSQQVQLRGQYDTVLTELQKQKAKVLKKIFSFSDEMRFGTESLAGKSFEELEQLFIKGQLEGRAKELFLELQKIKDAGVDVDRMLAENTQAAREMFTGTTTDNIVDSIADGFLNGLRSASDFADKFEDLMRGALINALKVKALEGPLNDFFIEFANLSESDGGLTAAEIDQLRALYGSIIQNAQAQFDQLQQISGINLATGSGSNSNSLSGAVKGITQQQADLLAGQFGGLRLTALEQLTINKRQLDSLNAIQVNTGATVIRMSTILEKMDYYYRDYGIKIR